MKMTYLMKPPAASSSLQQHIIFDLTSADSLLSSRSRAFQLLGDIINYLWTNNYMVFLHIFWAFKNSGLEQTRFYNLDDVVLIRSHFFRFV